MNFLRSEFRFQNEWSSYSMGGSMAVPIYLFIVRDCCHDQFRSLGMSLKGYLTN